MKWLTYKMFDRATSNVANYLQAKSAGILYVVCG